MPEVEGVGGQAQRHQRWRAQQPRHQRSGRPRAMDNQRRAQAGKQRLDPGEGRRPGQPQDGEGDGRKAQSRQGVASPADDRAWQRAHRQQGAHQELPDARQRRIEGEVTVDPRRPDAVGERPGGDQPDDHARRPSPHPAQQQQGERKDDVELLLDGQGPGVQQGRSPFGQTEIVTPAPEQQVGQKAGHREQAGPVASEIHWQEDPGREAGHGEHDQQGRHDPPEPPLVETGQREPAIRGLVQDQAGDQVAGDDEEDVDPDEAAGESRGPGMEQHHRRDSQPPQAVEFGPVGCRC